MTDPTPDVLDVLQVLRARINAEPVGRIDTAALAAAAHLDGHELHRFLHVHLRVTPVQFVRHHRLDAVHRVIQAGDVDPSVAARDWGFVHLRRFTDAYIERHGHSPAETVAAAADGEY
ncbi:helix-turn-helix domain-containing protein [Curtobacterium sp. ME12]|uniref:helix-turn-helix domain-containing protein n=1 Tax=Curtobacterium sp. ME12 TaxID=2744253 RepID=UPI0015F75083|nr:helix-turn-helix domain-containing protein [Curtobacterium sp. ME12]